MHAKKIRRLAALSVGLFLYAVYLFIYRGGFHAIDEVSMFAVTESLVKFGQFNTNQIAWTQWTTSQAEAQGFFGRDGNVYSKKGLALSLAQAPLYWLALQLPNIGMLQTVSLLNALVTAVTGMLIFLFLRRMQFSRLTGAATALIFGLATIAIVYAKYLFSEPLAGLLLLLTAYMLFAYRQEGGLRHLVIAGAAAGLAVLTRANNLFLLPIFGLYLVGITGRRQKTAAKQTPASKNEAGKRLRLSLTNYELRVTSYDSQATLPYLPFLVFVLTVALTGLLMPAYNVVRSGNPFHTGYDLTLFSADILGGLYKLLFSPLRGLFVYSPILLLSLPGWRLLRKRYPAEAWLFLGLTGTTLLVFAAWSSGEGLSWGSRFLVPIVPFFAICLAPIVAKVTGSGSGLLAATPTPTPKTDHSSASPPQASLTSARGRSWPHLRPAEGPAGLTRPILRFTFYTLLLASLFIQSLGVAVNPWVYLARLQADFGGEFFLENTPALYDFSYSQIGGQLQNWSPEHSDLAWFQGELDGWAFGSSAGLLILSGWLLWQGILAGPQGRRGAGEKKISSRLLRSPVALLLAALTITYILLGRYYHTDRQFGPPDDAYTQALETAVSQMASPGPLVTVAQEAYHVPMNRFKHPAPLIGFARQAWPPPPAARPLLRQSSAAPVVGLVTVGLPPAAPDNAAERWLAANNFKINEAWFGDSVRLARYATTPPAETRPLGATLGQEVRLVAVDLRPVVQAGRPLPVEFIWRPLEPPEVDYTLFLQLLDSTGSLVAQHDGPPNGGYSPTSTWRPGRTVATRHALGLPPDLSSGDYRLIAGLYHPETGERLVTPAGRDFIDLGQVRVAEIANSK